jgi:transcriptional regulator with XRE-family HTH domain
LYQTDQTGRNRYAGYTVIHTMKDSSPSTASLPTPEQVAGRRLRLLRQLRDWSQQDLVEKMRPYGYEWSQATVTRLEAATRPIRLNELADLAALYGVPVAQFLESLGPESAGDDLEALKREIEKLTAERLEIQEHLDRQEALAEEAAAGRDAVAAHLAHVDRRLGVLMQWVPQFLEITRGVVEKGDRRD